MIFDRTYKDIIDGKRILNGKVQLTSNAVNLSSEEQKIVNKAFFNLEALNRITSQMLLVKENIELFGHECTLSADVKKWQRNEFFKHQNFINLINDIKTLVGAAISVSEDSDNDIPETNKSSLDNCKKIYSKINNTYTYINLNYIEEVLYLLSEFANVWVVMRGQTLYIYNAYNAMKNGEVLTVI